MQEALTFDDVLLIPQYSDVDPNKVNVSCKLTPTLKLIDQKHWSEGHSLV